MAVVHGDRIGESAKLNRRSVAAQDFYALLLSKAPDDFGRFRREPAHVALALYPRREMTQSLLRHVARILDELERPDESGEVSIRTWVVDGVRFAEITGWKPRGNRYHRTPEPEWSQHVHQGACRTTAIARAREWGDHKTAQRLSNEMKELHERKRTERGAGSYRDHHSPSPPSPPSLNNPPSPPLDAGGAGEPDDRGEDDGETGPLAGVSAQVQVLVSLAAGWGLRFDRPTQREWRRQLRAGITIEQIRVELEREVAATSAARARQGETTKAWDWINAQDGGRDGLALEVARRLVQLPDSDHRAERDAWALERKAPPGVVMALITAISYALLALRKQPADPEGGVSPPAAAPPLIGLAGGRR